MLKCLLAPLLETLRPHFDLSKTRLETLAVLLVGLANCRTVNLSHLASQFPGGAQHGSNSQNGYSPDLMTAQIWRMAG